MSATANLKNWNLSDIICDEFMCIARNLFMNDVGMAIDIEHTCSLHLVNILTQEEKKSSIGMPHVNEEQQGRVYVLIFFFSTLHIFAAPFESICVKNIKKQNVSSQKCEDFKANPKHGFS